jgi:hypothetical protein
VAIVKQVAEPRHPVLVGIALDDVLTEAVGGEEQQLVVAPVAMVSTAAVR